MAVMTDHKRLSRRGIGRGGSVSHQSEAATNDPGKRQSRENKTRESHVFPNSCSVVVCLQNACKSPGSITQAAREMQQACSNQHDKSQRPPTFVDQWPQSFDQSIQWDHTGQRKS